ncbi:trypsin-like peptidase domain-containing protein [Candidatus Poribacteria bacterium]|nr:trypsin-like peptidase domain-containing protein [Candidatus Poribacteria bacterium]
MTRAFLSWRVILATSALVCAFVAGAVLPGGGSAAGVAVAHALAGGDDPPRPAKGGIPAVVARVSPSVVSVGAIKQTVVYDHYADFFSPFFMRPRTAHQKMPYLGSGFLVDKEGHIVTNFHVIEDSVEVFVTFTDGRELPAKVLDADRFIDVALLEVDSPKDELPEPIVLGDSDQLQIGETALAIGNPFGNLIEDPRPTVTKGVVSALHRSFRPDPQNMRVYQDMIQTDAAINPGNSGGPLVDEEGRVIGINTFIFSNSGGSVGLGFAIPINRARNFIEEIKTHGHLRDLLIDFDALTLNTPRIRGAVVNFVQENGPADKAGLDVGDVITEIDGRSIASREDVLLLLASKQVDDNLKLTVWREGQERAINYQVSEAIETGISGKKNPGRRR